jgi:hypothetical protein
MLINYQKVTIGPLEDTSVTKKGRNHVSIQDTAGRN